MLSAHNIPMPTYLVIIGNCIPRGPLSFHLLGLSIEACYN